MQFQEFNITQLLNDFSQLIQPFYQSMDAIQNMFDIRYLLCGVPQNSSGSQTGSNSNTSQPKKIPSLPLKGGMI